MKKIIIMVFVAVFVVSCGGCLYELDGITDVFDNENTNDEGFFGNAENSNDEGLFGNAGNTNGNMEDIGTPTMTLNDENFTVSQAVWSCTGNGLNYAVYIGNSSEYTMMLIGEVMSEKFAEGAIDQGWFGQSACVEFLLVQTSTNSVVTANTIEGSAISNAKIDIISIEPESSVNAAVSGSFTNNGYTVSFSAGGPAKWVSETELESIITNFGNSFQGSGSAGSGSAGAQGSCEICGGTGICANTYCVNGMCTVCVGKGYVTSPTYGQGGDDRTPCYTCDETGRCTWCNGTGRCQYCGW